MCEAEGEIRLRGQPETDSQVITGIRTKDILTIKINNKSWVHQTCGASELVAD